MAGTMSLQRPAYEVPRLSVADLDRDPHGLFRELRPVTPLVQREDGSYVVIRGNDVERLLRDERTRQVETEKMRSQGITSGALYDVFANSMLFSNGTTHRRRRAPLSRAFGFRLIAAMRPRIRAIAAALLIQHEARGEMNFLDEYAALIPARTICMLLGLPDDDIPSFTSWIYSLSRGLGSSFTTAEVVPEMEQSARNLMAYTTNLLAARRVAPRDDFLTDYVAVVAQEDSLTAVEILSQVVMVILAASDTTRTALAALIFVLLQHRDQWEAICRDATLIPGAVSEVLRYEPPVGSIPRFSLQDIDIDGRIIPAHYVVSLSTLSAMRDPVLYSEPERFDILRADHTARHLVFGGGVHRCLGESLARVELEESLAAITEHLPQMVLTGEHPKVLGHSGVRKVTTMTVGWLR
jgi:cytochrome P450 family 103